MIIGIGTDICDVNRIKALLDRFGQRFEDKMFAPVERCTFPDNTQKARHYAKRFAAKEAAVKALGTGFSDGIMFHDVAVSKTAQGKPEIVLSGTALEVAQALAPEGYALHLSLSDEMPYALAYVVFEAR